MYYLPLTVLHSQRLTRSVVGELDLSLRDRQSANGGI
jgi:hypothetical protein